MKSPLLSLDRFSLAQLDVEISLHLISMSSCYYPSQILLLQYRKELKISASASSVMENSCHRQNIKVGLLFYICSVDRRMRPCVLKARALSYI